MWVTRRSMTSRSSMDEEPSDGAEPYELLFLAMFFGLAGVLLVASGAFGLSGLSVVFSHPGVAALAGGVAVLLPVSFVLLYARREHRKSLDRVERAVVERLGSVEAEAAEAVSVLSGHARALSRFHERVLSSHALQEDAQDRLEASHERQEALLLALEQRFEEARLGDADERLNGLLARQEACLARVLELQRSHGESPRRGPPQRSPSGPSGRPSVKPVSSYPVDAVPGVKADDADALSRRGVRITDTLLYADLAELSRGSGIEKERLQAWRRVAEMMVMVDAIEPAIAEELVERGVDNLGMLVELELDELVEILEGVHPALSDRSLARRGETILEEAKGLHGSGLAEQPAA